MDVKVVQVEGRALFVEVERHRQCERLRSRHGAKRSVDGRLRIEYRRHTDTPADALRPFTDCGCGRPGHTGMVQHVGGANRGDIPGKAQRPRPGPRRRESAHYAQRGRNRSPSRPLAHCPHTLLLCCPPPASLRRCYTAVNYCVAPRMCRCRCAVALGGAGMRFWFNPFIHVVSTLTSAKITGFYAIFYCFHEHVISLSFTATATLTFRARLYCQPTTAALPREQRTRPSHPLAARLPDRQIAADTAPPLAFCFCGSFNWKSCACATA